MAKNELRGKSAGSPAGFLLSMQKGDMKPYQENVKDIFPQLCYNTEAHISCGSGLKKVAATVV